MASTALASTSPGNSPTLCTILATQNLTQNILIVYYAEEGLPFFFSSSISSSFLVNTCLFSFLFKAKQQPAKQPAKQQPASQPASQGSLNDIGEKQPQGALLLYCLRRRVRNYELSTSHGWLLFQHFLPLMGLRPKHFSSISSFFFLLPRTFHLPVLKDQQRDCQAVLYLSQSQI